jgi:hypothetical protein
MKRNISHIRQKEDETLLSSGNCKNRNIFQHTDITEEAKYSMYGHDRRRRGMEEILY